MTALHLARSAALTGARLLTTGLVATLLALLAVAGLIALVSIFDVLFVVIDAVEVSALEAARQVTL